MKSGKMFLGILASFAGGAILGILLAPEKGSRTRRNILDSGEDYADDLMYKMEALVNGLTKKYDRAIQEASHFVTDGVKKNEFLKSFEKDGKQ